MYVYTSLAGKIFIFSSNKQHPIPNDIQPLNYAKKKLYAHITGIICTKQGLVEWVGLCNYIIVVQPHATLPE